MYFKDCSLNWRIFISNFRLIFQCLLFFCTNMHVHIKMICKNVCYYTENLYFLQDIFYLAVCRTEKMWVIQQQ